MVIFQIICHILLPLNQFTTNIDFKEGHLQLLEKKKNLLTALI